ncbi:MAG: tetratricopeptide repeat protein [Alphaproteobacteria bacterium]|nr:tetratricopeptide repeat protein [Alphaproteobacteria bacterium]MCW5744058.1 tetratricopeptide repeat protein [Alphaproteobacteria bacterium]
MTESAVPESLASLLREAVAHHRQGGLAEALAGYDAILAIDPGFFDALHLKGVIAAQQGRHDEAVALMRRALGVKPDHAGAHGNLGGLLLRLGRAEEALACFDALISLQPDHAGAQGARAAALHMLGRLDQAVAAWDRVLALDSGDATAWYNRGNALQALGRAKEALASHDRAVALRPGDVDAIYGQGNALQALGHFAEALARYDSVLALKDDHAEALSSRGNALRGLGRLEEALASHERSIALKPDNADAQYNRGAVLRALGRPEAALRSHDRALALRPGHARAHASRGNALRDLGRLDEALASYERALALLPDHADTWSDRGTALQGLLRLEESLASYERAIALRPGHVDAHWNRATALLLAGDFARGWREFEWRWRTQTTGRPGSWLGESSLAGRSILLRSEQGLGDTIQFARFAPDVMALGARVILSVQAPLRRLMASFDPEIEVVATSGTAADLDCPLMSLPLALGTTLDTIPAPPRYLAAEPDLVAAWRARLPSDARRRVGLAWSGNPSHRNDRNRSLPLAALAPLLDLDAHFVSLQKDVPERDAATLARLNLMRVDDELRDFADTAGLIEALDLVISVDTSVAHLAGALGKPVWILLPFSPDWRWLTGREDSPWYPSARLFRQTTPGDWADVVRRLGAALAS